MKKVLITLLLAVMTLTGSAQVAEETKALLGAWEGKLQAGLMSLTLIFHFEQADGNVICTMDSPDQSAKGIGCSKEFLSEDSVALKVEGIGATFRARRTGDELRGTFMQMGRRFPLTLKRGVEQLRRPQNPVEPYPYKTEEVTFTNEADHATLAGTLTYPVGYKGKKRVPVVLMITGSGLENRDEEIFDHKPFLVISDYLARNGIASLRYDDRSFGQSTGGEVKNATTLDFRRDAEAGINFLRSMKKFGSVGALGHSEGGSIVFMLGSTNAIDFAISMAGPGMKGDTLLTAQVNCAMQLQGQAIQYSVKQYRTMVQASHNAWMDWFLDYDPAADIAGVRCPVLAINGDKDVQVISSLNLPAIERTLPKNKKTRVKEYPGLNHLFQHCQTGLPTEYRTIEETISPEVLRDIAEWIKGL